MSGTAGPSSPIYASALTADPFDDSSRCDRVPALPGQAAYDAEARAAKRRYRTSRNFDDNRLGVVPTFAQSSVHLPSSREHRLSGRFSRDSESSRSNSHGSQYSQNGRSAVSLTSTAPSPNLSLSADDAEDDGLPRASYAAHMRVAHMIARHKAAQSSASLAMSTEKEEPDRNHRVFFRKSNNSSSKNVASASAAPSSNSRVSRWMSRLVRPL